MSPSRHLKSIFLTFSEMNKELQLTRYVVSFLSAIIDKNPEIANCQKGEKHSESPVFSLSLSPPPPNRRQKCGDSIKLPFCVSQELTISLFLFPTEFFSKLNIHMNHMSILLKCRFLFIRSWVALEILHFYQAPQVMLTLAATGHCQSWQGPTVPVQDSALTLLSLYCDYLREHPVCQTVSSFEQESMCLWHLHLQSATSIMQTYNHYENVLDENRNQQHIFKTTSQLQIA